MHLIEKALFSFIKKHPNSPLVVAYSGGVDSQVLLYALASLKQQSRFLNTVHVCHVNHGLSDNAQYWQDFAKEQCQLLNLPITICQVNVKAQPQQSLEALARNARYKALHSISNNPSLIFTGHHSDDQAETFLLALKRGSGVKGLSAMAAEIQQGKDIIARPLLAVSRADIVDYATQHELAWIEDESNLDTRFDRNFIRNNIMPLLTQRWPSIVKTINRSSENCHESQLLLDELAQQDLVRCQHDQTSLLIPELAKLSAARFNNLIRYFLAQQHCLMPSSEQLQQLNNQLKAETDKNPSVKVGESYFRRYKNIIALTPDFQDISGWQASIDVRTHSTEVKLPDQLGTLTISFSTGDNMGVLPQLPNNKHIIVLPEGISEVSLTFSHNNPTCQPDYRTHSRSLKKVLQELNIPTWQRKRIPFLYFDNVFVAAIGYFVCKEYTLDSNTKNSSQITLSISE